MAPDIQTQYKWQPVMLVSDRRIECDDCGALAVLIVLESCDDEADRKDWAPYCQSCWARRTGDEDD